MLQPFEVVTAKLLPAIRARLAQTLMDHYAMKQVEVARHLGITQAAVSHYKTASRGIDPELLKVFPEIDAFVEELGAQIAEGMPQTAQVRSLTTLIEGLMQTRRFCEYHKRIATIDPQCSVCFPSPPKP